MLIKAGVDISRLERKTRRGLQIVNDVFEENGSELIVTSTYEGNHGAGSLHYADQAFDTRPPTKHQEHVTILCISKLGKDWDVLPYEGYIHWERDPHE